MDDVLAVIVLRDIGGNAGVYVTRDVLTADHEAEELAGIESHASGSQRYFYFNDFALRKFFLAIKTLNGDDVGAELLVKMATADAQAAVCTAVLSHATVVLQHVVGLGRGGGDGELAQHVVVAVQFLHDEEEVHLVATISLYIKMSLGIANETRFFSYWQIE